ncbi:MAG: shikimate dehydrogenase [Armatimonadota bacterium]
MERFAFVIHPLSAKKDVARKYPFVKVLPESWVEWGMKHKSPMEVSHITGVRSKTGVEAEGWLVGCPLSPKLIMTMPVEKVYEKILGAIKIAEQLGAKIVGLGALTSVVGDAGVTIAERANIAVTTGNSYTIATAVEGAIEGAQLLGINPNEVRAAVVGATGSIGKTCAQLLAGRCAEIKLIGRSVDRLQAVADELVGSGGTASVATDVAEGIRDADIVVTVSSAVDAIIEPSFIKPGAVVCDVARPRDVGESVRRERDDVLIIDGGVIDVPGDVDFNFNFGFPPKTAYACMSETMILALEGRYKSYTLGREITVQQVKAISDMADKHGFKMAGFRSFERAVTSEQIEQIRKNAARPR